MSKIRMALLALLPLLVLNPAAAQRGCNEDDAGPSRSGRDASMLELSGVDPRAQIIDLVNKALQRSQSIGAVTLLAQAARADWEEAREQGKPRLTIDAYANHVGSMNNGIQDKRGMQGRLGLTATAPLFDFGRVEKATAWRTQLAESARQGMISSEQQLALNTVSLALDRGRYVLQAQVYGQYVRKMSCLVDALEIIVKADRGRASELVQAQKSQQQAEMAVEQTMSALRQTEIRLKRFVGEPLPASASYSSLLNTIPNLADIQQDARSASEVIQLEAQARAQANYAELVAANNKPIVSAAVSTGALTGLSKGQEWTAGVNLSIPILSPGSDAGMDAARRRAAAARLQRDDAIESRIYRASDMHEAATAAFDRARRIVEILRNSDRVRASTLQQWQQLGRRSLFDVMGSEAEYYALRVAHVNAIYDGQQAVALLWSLGRGVMTPLR
ncbi:TolC family protein [Pelomonas sp. SE-A7]|uniref:TolC family protein n=1 Tax=Pelomonas sp. SE-A7 TaxID=3054953 RepID=UPI00259CCEA6|nr:TolC family protein [Pelomonas sp. SE-A7]MDM4764963.1 TolC family protein [Pelomonas sp. SE-A7]